MFIFFQVSVAETVLKGKILGWDSKATDEAGITILDESNTEKVQYFKSDKDGSFEISLKSEAIYTLKISATNHKSFEFRILSGKESAKRILEISLEPYIYDKNSTPILLGNFNDWDFDIGVIEMQKSSDGKFYADVPTIDGEVRYQIMNILKGHKSRSINGTMNDDLIFDNEGDFESVIKSGDKIVRILFDPNKLATENQKVKFLNISPELKSQIELSEKLKDYSNNWRNQFIIAKMNKDSVKADSVRTSAFKELENIIASQIYLESKLFASFEYLQNINSAFDEEAISAINQDILKELLEKISPKSDIWQNFAYSIYTALHIVYDNPANSKFFTELINENINEEFKVKFLFDALRMSYQLNESESNIAIYNIIKEKYPDHKLTKKALREFSPFKRIAIGNKLPEFSIKSAVDTTKIITNFDFNGKYLLIDFWATWCGPCVMEIPLLQSIYDDYRDKGLEILSISLDETIGAPAKFDSGRFKIPWLNTWQAGEFDSEISEIFEIINIPTLIFVDKNGKIIEINGQLYGEDLRNFLINHIN